MECYSLSSNLLPLVRAETKYLSLPADLSLAKSHSTLVSHIPTKGKSCLLSLSWEEPGLWTHKLMDGVSALTSEWQNAR